MTIRQKVLRMLYPTVMQAGKWFGLKAGIKQNVHNSRPSTPLYDLQLMVNNGQIMSLAAFRGKKLLFVNTASNCGYTNQYQELQQLHEKHKYSLCILCFPSNDFKEQEKGTDLDIASFCMATYGVGFNIMKKSVVVNGPDQNPVYQWLTDARKNGWNNFSPEWNFSKYLVNENGVLTHYFGPGISPFSKEVVKHL